MNQENSSDNGFSTIKEYINAYIASGKTANCVYFSMFSHQFDYQPSGYEGESDSNQNIEYDLTTRMNKIFTAMLEAC